jgi:PKHD-type hydroxylase
MAIILEPRWKSHIIQTNNPVLTPQQCQEVIQMGQNQPNLDAEVGIRKNVPTDTHQKGYKKTGLDKKKRVTTISWIPFDIGKPMYETIERWMLNINANHFGFDGMQIGEQAQYTEYPKGGFYEWHSDCDFDMSSMPSVRKISMTLLLSDPKDFKGGELELIEDKKRAKLQQGYAIFFASFIRHRVKPVTKGVRKSLVMWFGGPSFK